MCADRNTGLVRPGLNPTTFERLLAFGSVWLLLIVVAAVAKGHDRWREASLLVWLHLATLIIAMILTPILLLRPRGVRRHRQLGYIWVVAMTTTAALSLGIRTINPGGFSAIHALSVLTLIMAPVLAWRAHRHQVQSHRVTAVSLVTGALLIAGFFTFPFHRMLGRWLFG